MSFFSPGNEPPYYAVIFSSQRTSGENGYGEIARYMEELASKMPGYIGIESVRGQDGAGITISYWDCEEAIAAWRQNAEHKIAQQLGQSKWYEHYRVQIARVERTYGAPTPFGLE